MGGNNKKRRRDHDVPRLMGEAISLVMVVEYDGSAFFGSQLQAGQRTVQGELELGIARLELGHFGGLRSHGQEPSDQGDRVRVVLASRTDKGVHSKGQVNADISKQISIFNDT